MRVRQSVKVTKAKHARFDQSGIIEELPGPNAKGVERVIVKFDTPDPDGELVELTAEDVLLVPGSN